MNAYVNIPTQLQSLTLNAYSVSLLSWENAISKKCRKVEEKAIIKYITLKMKP